MCNFNSSFFRGQNKLNIFVVIIQVRNTNCNLLKYVLNIRKFIRLYLVLTSSYADKDIII